MREYNKKHNELYGYLSEHTGVKVRNPADVFDIFGTLTAEVNIRNSCKAMENILKCPIYIAVTQNKSVN